VPLFSHKRSILLAAVIGGVLVWNYNRAPDHAPKPEAPAPPPQVTASTPQAPTETPQPPAAGVPVPPATAPPAAALPAPAGGSPPPPGILPGSADGVPAAPEDISGDLSAVDSAIRDFRAVLGENPIGSNAEITSALLGNNLKQIKLGVPAGSQINADGEMCDRWGTPYFFHQVSATEMEIRSAGPDRRMWTGDDSEL
jgi:hypothetical protein